MGQTATRHVWSLISLVLLVSGAVLTICWLWLRREAEAINSLWDDICLLLRERCHLVRELSQHLRAALHTNPKLVDDIDYLLERMEQTADPGTHAAVRNSLTLTVQTAVEQFHRSSEFRSDSELGMVLRRIEATDDRLGPLRDRYNARVKTYTERITTLPFSLVSRFVRKR